MKRTYVLASMVNNYNALRSDAGVHVKIHSETAITVASLGVSSGALTTVHCPLCRCRLGAVH